MHYIRNLLVRQLLWQAQQDPGEILAPADADLIRLHVGDMSDRLFNMDLFQEPYEEDDYRLDVTAPLWHPVFGTVEQAGDSFRLLPADGTQPMHIHPQSCCRMEAWVSGAPVVLLYDRKNPRTGDQVLVTEAEYRLADPFPCVYDKAYMLLEYLKLDQPVQERVFLFLTKEDQTEAVFARMCHLALKACQAGNDWSSVPKVPRDTPEDSSFLELLGFSDKYMERDLWMLSILLAVRQLIGMFEEEDGRFALEELIRSEACCHHPALADCVERILPGWATDDFASQLLSVGLEDVDEFAYARIRIWLFALLEARLPLSRPVLQDICRKHLCHPMTARLLRSLRSGLFSSNAEILREYIEEMYPEKYAVPCSGLPAALAVIRIHDRNYMPDLVQEEAERLLLKGTGEADVLLGIAMMTVYLQFRSEHIRSHREPVVLSREAEVTARVLRWLQDPGGIWYPYVCELAYWLYLSCAVPENAFADLQVVHAASIAWNERTCPARVEKLVSTLPVGLQLPRSDALERMRRGLGKRFDKAMLEKNTSEKPIPLFRSCMVLGCWEKRYQQLRFQCLLKKIDGDPQYMSGENREYMRRLEWEMLENLIDPTQKQKAPTKAVCSVVSDETQVRVLLKAFRAVLKKGETERKHLADRFQSGKLTISSPSLVTDWFYALCTLGLAEEAHEFYRIHQEILDRPWIYRPDTMGLSVERPYHAASCFWNGPPRWEKGLELAANMGYPIAQWQLTQQKEKENSLGKPFRQKSRVHKQKVLDFFLSQRGFGGAEIRNYWMLHYDDASVTEAALRDPENHNMILQFGYCGSKKMVQAALEVEPSHVCYVSKALLKDDQVALAVLEQSCRYLHLLFSPVTENREYIRNLILLQQETVVLNRTKKWVRDDKELMIPAVEAYPQYFEQVSERLRGDREVVLAALKGAIRKTTGSYWLRHILRNAEPELLKDPAIAACVKERCPEFGEGKTEVLNFA